MLELAKIISVHNLRRGISTCNVYFNKYAKREGKFMTKIMRGEQGKRKWYANTDRVSTSGQSSSPGKPALPLNNRRNTVLNKIFMKYITDLMATGEVAPEIVGKKIEISRVSVTPDFHKVNVFWLARGSEEQDSLVEEVLTRAQGPLRHELSQLRVMGSVPEIKFVRDKQYIRFVEVDRLLAKADFGEDFVPSDPTLRLRTTPVLNVKLPETVWSDIAELEGDVDEEELWSAEEPLPEMRNDVLGLDHARIMAKIKSTMDKSRAALQNRALNIVSPVPPREPGQSSVVTEYLTNKQRQEAFAAFLSKRLLDEKKRKQYQMERDYDHEDDEYSSDEENFNDDNDDIFDIDIHYDEKTEER